MDAPAPNHSASQCGNGGSLAKTELACELLTAPCALRTFA